MKSTSVLGFVILALFLCAMFAGLYFAYSAVGKAVERAEAQDFIIPCADQNPCAEGNCTDGYCRKES